MPEPFWHQLAGTALVGLLSIVGAIMGIWLTNRGNDLRLRREREHTLKKEIFLDAVEAIGVGMASIMNYANLDIPDNKVASDYAAKAPAFSKAYMVANPETISALMGSLKESRQRKPIFYRSVCRFVQSTIMPVPF